MFPVDSLPTAYVEDRTAAEAGLREEQARAFRRAQAAASQKRQREQQQHQQQQQPPHAAEPQNLTQALLQRPPLSRPGSSSVLGNIFQGFVKAASASPPNSRSPSATPTPTLGQQQQQQEKSVSAASVSEEMEKLIAEKKRDADICSMPHWYH